MCTVRYLSRITKDEFKRNVVSENNHAQLVITSLARLFFCVKAYADVGAKAPNYAAVFVFSSFLVFFILSLLGG